MKRSRCSPASGHSVFSEHRLENFISAQQLVGAIIFKFAGVVLFGVFSNCATKPCHEKINFQN